MGRKRRIPGSDECCRKRCCLIRIERTNLKTLLTITCFLFCFALETPAQPSIHGKPLRSGYWKYEIDYRGRAGSLDKWEVRYNPAKERFEGKLIVVPGE